jgi:hypothetical protein
VAWVDDSLSGGDMTAAAAILVALTITATVPNDVPAAGFRLRRDQRAIPPDDDLIAVDFALLDHSAFLRTVERFP